MENEWDGNNAFICCLLEWAPSCAFAIGWHHVLVTTLGSYSEICERISGRRLRAPRALENSAKALSSMAGTCTCLLSNMAPWMIETTSRYRFLNNFVKERGMFSYHDGSNLGYNIFVRFIRRKQRTHFACVVVHLLLERRHLGLGYRLTVQVEKFL
jgi:hypothetical protein